MTPDNFPPGSSGWAIAAFLIAKEIIAYFRSVKRVHDRIDLTNKNLAKLAKAAGVTLDGHESPDE